MHRTRRLRDSEATLAGHVVLELGGREVSERYLKRVLVNEANILLVAAAFRL